MQNLVYIHHTWQKYGDMCWHMHKLKENKQNWFAKTNVEHRGTHKDICSNIYLCKHTCSDMCWHQIVNMPRHVLRWCWRGKCGPGKALANTTNHIVIQPSAKELFSSNWYHPIWSVLGTLSPIPPLFLTSIIYARCWLCRNPSRRIDVAMNSCPQTRWAKFKTSVSPWIIFFEILFVF